MESEEWPVLLRWVPKLRCDRVFGILGEDDDNDHPGGLASDLAFLLGPITDTKADLKAGGVDFEAAAAPAGEAAAAPADDVAAPAEDDVAAPAEDDAAEDDAAVPPLPPAP